jgi:ArsR family transcriptional regulator, arsenate/arsenite/antimonite-responsive transcriptional repressor
VAAKQLTTSAERQIERIANALASPKRAQILREIGQADGDHPCTAITDAHELSAPTISHHLKELETAGLIEIIRDGKFMKLRLRRDVLNAYLAHLATI